MKIRSRLLPFALLALAACAFFPSAALAGDDRDERRGERNLEKQMHRLEETMENLEEAIERAAETGHKDTAKQLRASLDALRFVKKQIAARMEGKRAKAPRREKAEREKAERIKLDLEDLKLRREELRERMADTARAKEKGRNFIKRIRLEKPKTVVAKDEHVIIVETDRDGKVTRRVIRGDGNPQGLLRVDEDLEIKVEELFKRRRPDDRKLRDKMQEMVERARDLRRGRPGKDGQRGRDGHDRREEGPHGDLAQRVERLQHHVEELTQGLRHMRQQVEELKRANKKLHMHLKGAAQPRRVQPLKAPVPPKPVIIRGGPIRLGPPSGGQGGRGPGQADDGRLARIEGLLKKLLELQIHQAKAR